MGFPPGVYSYSVSLTRYATATGTITIVCGSNTTTVNLVAATGYVCTQCCPDPIATTLHLTTSSIGSPTLTYIPGTGYTGSSVDGGGHTVTWLFDMVNCTLCATFFTGAIAAELR